MNTIVSSHKKSELTAQLLWTALILMFFVLQAILWTVAISMTAGDKSHSVVAGYDEQALNWDQVKQRQSASEALGWGASIRVDDSGDIQNNHQIVIKLLDADGTSISNASIELIAFHRGRAAEKQSISMANIGNGQYEGKLKLTHSGHWQFSATATANEKQFLFNERLLLKSNRNL